MLRGDIVKDDSGAYRREPNNYIRFFVISDQITSHFSVSRRILNVYITRFEAFRKKDSLDRHILGAVVRQL